IGALQSNKVRYMTDDVVCVQSFSSMRSLKALADEIGKNNPSRKLNIFLPVNLGGETQKSGFTEDEFGPLVEMLALCPNLNPVGLMTIGVDGDAKKTEKVFVKCRESLDTFKSLGIEMNRLSMGMSGDWRVACKC